MRERDAKYKPNTCLNRGNLGRKTMPKMENFKI